MLPNIQNSRHEEKENCDYHLHPTGIIPAGKKKILVVDDDVEMAAALKHSLARCYGIDVQVASDPYEAINMMLDGSYDFVLLDWNFPRMNGFSAICEAEKIIHQAAQTMRRFKFKKVRVATFSAGMSQRCRLPSTRHFTYVGHVNKQSKLQNIVQTVHNYFSGLHALTH